MFEYYKSAVLNLGFVLISRSYQIVSIIAVKKSTVTNLPTSTELCAVCFVYANTCRDFPIDSQNSLAPIIGACAQHEHNDCA